jgi:AhpD family alkylhydroperoxidase
MLTRDQVYKDITDKFGFVPTFMKTLPDSSLGLEWELFKKMQIEDGSIPQKYRELIGLGISGATKCSYCTLFHTEMAKLHGATEAEIEEAVHYSKMTAGWSAYVNGLQVDYDNFKDEIRRACDFVRSKEKKAA